LSARRTGIRIAEDESRIDARETVLHCRLVRIANKSEPVSLDEIRTMAESLFGDMVKSVVDVQRELVALDAEMHADLESELLAQGSQQEDLWGINLYPDLPAEEWVEFDSLINIRPSQGNRSRGVEDPAARDRIVTIVDDSVRR
jgi:hypothetical protein